MKKTIFMTLVVILFGTLSLAETIGEVETSGVIIKDTLEVSAFDDGGVTCYVALPKRSLDFVNQTDASISCRQTGSITPEQKTNKDGIFTEKNHFYSKNCVSQVFLIKKGMFWCMIHTPKN